MKWFRLAALALFVPLAAARSAAAAPDPALSAPDPSLVRGTLPNGLRYAILPNRTPRQQVSIRMQVDAGAALETDSERGTAHFVEHMAFDGSRRFPGNSAEARFAAAGIGAGRDQNAFTDATGVLYVFDIPQVTADKLDLAFDWMRDVGDGLTFDPAQAAREKGVVLQEIAVRRTGSTEVGEAISRFSAPGLLAARRSPGGTPASVTALDAAALKAFHDRWYRPERTLLVIVGDVDARDIRARLVRSFGGWTAPQPAPTAPVPGAVDPDRPLSVLAVTTPNFAQGLVRDLRVRWALEEAGMPYATAFVGHDVPREAYRAIQPFGQVPALRDGELELFESGSIVLYIAERSDALLPPPGARRAHAVEWMFAALNTVENPIQLLAAIDIFYVNEDWAAAARVPFLANVRKRLSELEAALGDKEYLTGEFSAADLLMATVLRILRHTDELDGFPKLAAYKARCEQRPAFQRALADHMADFAAAA